MTRTEKYERNQKILALINSGVKKSEVCKVFNLSPPGLKYIISIAGKPLVIKHQEDIPKIVSFREQGFTFDEIAQQFGLSRQRIEQIISPMECKYVILKGAKEYLDLVTEKPRCIKCGGEIAVYMLCKPCRDRFRIVRKMANNLRKFKATGNIHSIRVAMSLLNRNHISKEELKVA